MPSLFYDEGMYKLELEHIMWHVNSMQKNILCTIVPMLFLNGGCADAQTIHAGSPETEAAVQEQRVSVLSDAVLPLSDYDQIFDRLAVLIRAEIPIEEQYKYLGNNERKGYLEQIKQNDSPRRSKFEIILDLNNGEGENLLRRLPRGDEFSDIWLTLDNLESEAELEKSEAELEKSEAELDYITNLANSLQRD